MSKWVIGLLLIGALFSINKLGGDSVSLGPGIKAPGEPSQTLIPSGVPFYHEDFELMPLAEYSLTAKVLSRKNYRWGRGARISPLDFALGWGEMSDEVVLKDIDIRQFGRFYFWSAKVLPIPQREITRQSANVHLIPGSSVVKSILDGVKEGQLVYLEGKLVEVRSPDWNARSSLTREDSGAGACEILFVEIAYPCDIDLSLTASGVGAGD